MPDHGQPENLYWRGIRLFNEGAFFDAHEALEDVWREAPAEEKRFLQGLIQIAVALHHYSKGNLIGAASLLARGEQNLAGYAETYRGVDLRCLRRDISQWREALARGGSTSDPPRIRKAGVRIAVPVDPISTKRTPVVEMRVPMLDLRRQYARIREELTAALERVCSSQNFILGEEVASFEGDTARFLGVQAAVGCASGTDALWLALVAAGVQPGDTVITTPFSFVASATAILRAGARPVFVDIDPSTFNVDARLVADRLRDFPPDSLRAIMPVHIYGQCADMDTFDRIAAEYKVAIVEDAAQAFGAAWRGRRAGSLGVAAGFSFYPSKNLSALGDGGCVTTNDLALAERIRQLRNHGSRERYYYEEVGWNSRLDAIQAAALAVKLKHLPQWNEERRERAAAYDRLFTQAGLVGEKSPVRLPQTTAQAYHIFHQYVIRAAQRDELRKFLAGRGIATEVYYPLPLHLQKALSYLGYWQGDFPEAERAAKEVVALPMFPELTEDEQQYVVDGIAAFYS